MIDESPIPFEAFMQHALHDPHAGYYARRISGVGRRGDFTTAPMLSDILARAIARWAAKAMQESGCRHLIEIGPGQGTLASEVLSHLPWHIRWRTRLHLVETSVPLRQRQQELLGTRATWHTSALTALTACRGHAILYSNELVDAFAVRVFQKTAEGWQELAVSRQLDGHFHESLLPAAKLPDSSSFSQPHANGQWVEVHESYHQDLLKWLPAWKNGRLLTIDYGADADRLYFRRPRGTLRGYFHQQRLERPEIYQNVGHQDLTADVNFTDLRLWSEPWVSEQHQTSFGEFIQRWAEPDSTIATALTDPAGAGGAFQVLEQKPADTRKP